MLQPLLQYNDLRERGFKKAWKIAGMTRWTLVQLRRVFLLFIGLGSFMFVDTTIAEKLYAEQERDSTETRVERVERAFISLLNNKAFYIDNELHACKLINTKFSKDTKHLEDLE
jgi:hypothetical protein